MIVLVEAALAHAFADGWCASKYDGWPFYREHLESAFGGAKGVDIVAWEPTGTLWLIEVKDLRRHRRTKPLELEAEVAFKVRDSLAGLLAAATWHAEHANQLDARAHVRARKLRVVLHLEQPALHSKLFPRAYDPAKVQQRLKQLVKAVDAHPTVVDVATSARLPWTVTIASTTSPA